MRTAQLKETGVLTTLKGIRASTLDHVDECSRIKYHLDNISVPTRAYLRSHTYHRHVCQHRSSLSTTIDPCVVLRTDRARRRLGREHRLGRLTSCKMGHRVRCAAQKSDRGDERKERGDVQHLVSSLFLRGRGMWLSLVGDGGGGWQGRTLRSRSYHCPM